MLHFPKGKKFGYEVSRRRQKEALWLDPQYDTCNTYWLARFHKEREAALNRFDGDHPPPKKNKAERIVSWSRLGRTVKEVIEDARLVAFI
jgi:hypothetical protein